MTTVAKPRKFGMRILIAPDKFKNSLGADEVAENIAIGLRESLSQAETNILPVADGGEGTAAVISKALGGSWVHCQVHDPLGHIVQAHYATVGRANGRKLAVMEMSEASGLRRVAAASRNPIVASSFGTGEMLLDALGRRVDEIIIGLGGSATNDAGFGMARALGLRFFDQEKKELCGEVPELIRLAHISKPENLTLPQITIAADVQNPLLGERGATRVFGPQKGATPEQMERLERALATFADVVTGELSCDFRDTPGAGAAGGLGFALMSFCGATIRLGFDVVAEEIKLEEAIRESDLIVTGEGCLDRQTLEGKAPAGVARLARKYGKRVFAIVGRSTGDREVEGLFEKVFRLARDPITEPDSIERAPELLRERARELAKVF